MFDAVRLGDILIASGLASEADIQEAVQHQKKHGGRLGDALISMGVVSERELESVIQAKPNAPRSIKETDVSGSQLLKYMIKAIHVGGLETSSEVKDVLKLPSVIINRLIDEAIDRGYVTVLGSKAGGMSREQRYVLSQAGQFWAKELLLESQYVGPAPVSLRAMQERISRQRITNERVSRSRMENMLSGLVISTDFVDRLGPAINSGRCILLYGPPGNGKTSVAERIGRMFSGVIYVPYCVEIDGQIMKVYDPSIHEAVDSSDPRPQISIRQSVIEEDFDQRWVPCRRPVVVVGGELTLDMLDLDFNSLAKYYEAPLHVKALGGTFIVDDFGRQFVKPTDMLNRWIVPLESRVDFLKLHTGKTFTIPFDELVIFSTNLAPRDLMDPAFLRRIPYKLKTIGPTVESFKTIFEHVSEERGLALDEEMFHFVLNEIRERSSGGLACYQPKFIAEQVLAACKYQGIEPAYRRDLVCDALSNLYVADKDKDETLAAAA